jgi:hypothetical protein
MLIQSAQAVGCYSVNAGSIREIVGVMQDTNKRRRMCALVGGMLAGAAAVLAASSSASRAQDEVKDAPTDKPQTILVPGLYLFQTRTRDGSCNDAPRTGYVTSAVATLDGVPGSRALTLRLLNSKYWPVWKLNVTADDAILGDANMFDGKDGSVGSSHFEMKAKKDRFQGVGTREYSSTEGGKAVRCRLNYDVLLKPMD